MRSTVLMPGLFLLAAACSSSRAAAPARTEPVPARTEQPAAPARATVPETKQADKADKAKNTPARGPRKLNGVPPGHYPKPGECRLWYSGKPPGQQPKPQSCASLRGKVPAGAFVLYGGTAYDADHDWAAEAKRDRNSVPETIVDILRKRS